MREKHKYIELSNRKWRIEKLNALAGSRIIFKLFSRSFPLKGEEVNILQGLGAISPEEFTEIQKECLMACAEIQHSPTGEEVPLAVMLASGVWGVDNIEDDAGLALALTIAVLLVNMQNFFADGALTELAQGGSGLPPSNAST